ncbi:hypothetical protein K1719_001645 [Acacia pycnantha]|nr:hypothetical protein K1719_001645 [Acacia pycnantha]
MDATLSLVLIEAILILLAIAISKAIRLISPLDDSCKDVDSIPTVSSPHIVATPPATKYDVFLSFRGEDTRDVFTSYLYEALCNVNIHTFMDHKLHKGQHIAPILLKTIEESEISLIIFSKDYASSTWCMDELVHIMKCRDKYGRIVIPVFYHVDPSNIRKQNGSFGDGFAKLKFRFKHNLEKVQEWKNAFIQSTKLSGWDSKNIRPESKLVKKIVEDIVRKLNTKSSFCVEGLVGIDNHIQKIEELLHEARIVGIWGMGGIGKTTLARAVFHKLKEQFEASSFVGNVREQLTRIGLDELQKKCLEELLKDEDVKAYNLKSTFVKSRLHRKKILLIFDDVDNSIAIEDLIKVCDWFGKGSRIIITSRDMQVLKNTFASTTYHVPQLDSHQALHLFSLKAFKQNEPSKSYLELSKWVVDYCGGNPLALIVLGCFLHGRGNEEWESARKKLNQTLHKDIFIVLKLSFDGLDDTQKNIFLDLAFFLIEAQRISLEDCTRRIYDSSAHIEISGIEAIRCLSWDLSKIRRRTTWRTSNFRKMHNLIFFKVHKSDERKPSELTICDNLDYLPEELKFFIWDECPFPHLPLHFCSENLVTLEMPNSNVRQLWNGNQHFPNLKEINVWGSKHLTALPDLSHTPKIKAVFLGDCLNLAQVYSSTVLGNLADIYVGSNDGPKQINIGGSMKGTRSRLVMAYNYLDVDKLSWNKVRMKVLVCGDIICGVRFKHVEMPLAEKAELRYLLPFVRKVELLEGPIEHGHADFMQHFDYDYDYDFDDRIVVKMKVRRRGGDRGGERHVVGPLTREMINDHHHQTSMEARDGEEEEEEEEDEEFMRKLRYLVELLEDPIEYVHVHDFKQHYDCYNDSHEMINDHHHQTSMEAREGEGEEEDEELMREYYCGGGNSSSDATIFIRVPNSITRWSLLRKLKLTLGKSDIMVEDSLILNSLSSLSHASCKPLLHQTLSFEIPPSAFTDTDGYHFKYCYNYLILLSFHVGDCVSRYLDYDLVLQYIY